MVVIVRYSDLTVGSVRLALCKIYQNIQRFRKNPPKCLDLGGLALCKICLDLGGRVTFVVAFLVYQSTHGNPSYNDIPILNVAME